MTDMDLAEIREANAKIEQAKEAERLARLELGRVIARVRARGVRQSAIAKELGITREQVRRLEDAARKADKGSPAPAGDADAPEA
ncbi:helix-turn-helix domain-containing protein [Streptomyces antibioticus]|uniref:helix-turn-helix domain-containing protein n=1 Tax=Streptomyces antibioticus TaxID=1890 RepID=UPI001961AC1B|nr:helix-turn-helix domain-containing protein [Streptomyces sp. S9]